MQLAAVLFAKVLGFVESSDLNPRGNIFYPDFVQELVSRYKFQKFPQSLAEFDEAKGVEFHEGLAGDKAIQKLTIFNTLLAVETRSSTADSKQILESMLEWGKERFGLNYHPGMIKRFAYVSTITFYSDVSILAIGSPLTNLAAKTGKTLSEIWQEDVEYRPIILSVGHDPSTRKSPIAPFSIQRRGEARFSENKYFSEAPLPTETHLQFLQEFEDELRAATTAPI